MRFAIYDELVSWYPLLDPLDDHEEEVAGYAAILRQALGEGRHRLLELGAGAGHNAFFLKREFDCTLTDIAPTMLAASRRSNPDCEHVEGDMRTLRLERTFDAVFVHDAVVYMTSEADLCAAAQTAVLHTRPGGASLFAPDTDRESFGEYSQLHENEEGDRALRCLEWSWDPDPNDDTYTVEYALLLRDGREMRAIHDRHVEGLFSKATWRRVLESVGFEVELMTRPHEPGVPLAGYTLDCFLCRRPRQ
jgi:SAM-dependent methyltransferase